MDNSQIKMSDGTGDDFTEGPFTNSVNQTGEETVAGSQQASSSTLQTFNNMPAQRIETLPNNEPDHQLIPLSEREEEKDIRNAKETMYYQPPVSHPLQPIQTVEVLESEAKPFSVVNYYTTAIAHEEHNLGNASHNEETAVTSHHNISIEVDLGEEKTNEHCASSAINQDTAFNERLQTISTDMPVEFPTSPPLVPTAGDSNMMESESCEGIFIQEPFDSKFSFSPTCSLHCVDTASSVFQQRGDENFLKGCKWSPDGTQVLTNSNDNTLRTFTPLNQEDTTTCEMNANCEMRESGLIYDYCWFPSKTDSNPNSCRVACTCPGSPIHLWDSNQGHIVSSYKAFDQCDEITHAYSLAFSPDGTRIYGGYKKCVRIFDTEYSHRKCSAINTFDSKTHEGYKGIVSCFCFSPEFRTFVTGSYSRHVGIYCSTTNQLMCLIQGQQGGVTHVMLSPDGHRLYTGGRKDPEIVCWDMRQPGHVLCTYLRDVQTNQRIYFDLSKSGRYLTSGNHDGSVQVWDTQESGHDVSGEIIMQPCYTFQAHRDCVNGVSFNPECGKLATTSGQRHFDGLDITDSDSDDSGMNEDQKVKDFSLKIWSIPQVL